jgi:serine/threonine-protein kinase PknG
MRAARLGGGVTTVPAAPEIDAASAIMANPVVPEEKRFCPKCGEPVGRARDGQPGRVSGFCANCRQPFSFEPKLAAGDLVAGQYLVAGCLAHGGLGWIYLARDRNVSDRWVVLKGLLNSADPDALAAAIAEQRFLAQVSHPNIVEIYNFVTHHDDGYIVMEYIGGTSLKSLLKQRMRARGAYDPLPVDQALAYLVEILPAFQYLHDLGLVYCDFKPDNIIQIGDEVRLIDLGGVRRVDDEHSAIFGTIGYQAPEVAELGTSVASDIYTIGRTLVVLTMEFRGYQTTYLSSLPPVEDTPVFARYDSFYRLVAKACAPSPDDRFASADELRVQMLGVLREVVSIDRAAGAATSSAASLLFDSPPITTDTVTWQSLPRLRRDPGDPQAGWLQTVTVSEAGPRLAQLAAAPLRSAEVEIETAYAALEAGQLGRVDEAVARMLAADPWEWRAVWMAGLAALARGDAATSQSSFNAVYGQAPGELAPKLALAHSCESSGEDDIAQALYTTCARTDAAYVPTAAFGLARLHAGRGDIDAAARALDLVPTSSRAYPAAQQEAARLLASHSHDVADLARAMDVAQRAGFAPRELAELAATVYRNGLAGVRSGTAPAGVRVGGLEASETGMRLGLEKSLRDLARVTDDVGQRVALVDEANAVRPWSLR